MKLWRARKAPQRTNKTQKQKERKKAKGKEGSRQKNTHASCSTERNWHLRFGCSFCKQTQFLVKLKHCSGTATQIRKMIKASCIPHIPCTDSNSFVDLCFLLPVHRPPSIGVPFSGLWTHPFQLRFPNLVFISRLCVFLVSCPTKNSSCCRQEFLLTVLLPCYLKSS